MAIGDLFDTYSLRARLQPALLTLFPAILALAAWYPALYQTAAALGGLVAACGVTLFLAHLARKLGRAVEKRLFAAWGGKPTTIWLRHRDSNLDPHTKARYHAFLAGKVPSWRAPTESEETADAAAADLRYEAGVKWLLEHTRDQKAFPLVFKENVSYGFRRNAYGLRPIGFAITVLCTLASGYLAYKGWGADGANVSGVGLGALAVSVIALAAWTFVVTLGWVRDAADAYARALLSACDRPSAPKTQPRSRSAKKKSEEGAA
nr:hypothetical protein [Nitrosomonas nitrosa]